MKNEQVPLLTRRKFPWVIWILWKNRNILAFESQNFNALETMRKINEEADLCFLSQEIDKVCEERVSSVSKSLIKRWRTLPEPWLKCNVGCVWDKAARMGRACLEF